MVQLVIFKLHEVVEQAGPGLSVVVLSQITTNGQDKIKKHIPSVPGYPSHLRENVMNDYKELQSIVSPGDVSQGNEATSLKSVAHFEKILTAISSQPFLQAKFSVHWTYQVQTEMKIES